ncbi:hypothetical protein M7I_1624 [Glarea lozoyensis 74030]|uniref:Uncharacterized protein n=1 Tax=Glarea lozoyensis (strain ATCC 74030 / MF5533) TaxID=1104152 RepID=H0EGK7_GLAL7|nr:hypothetical protein M7I_1624 [Glarea lozoyensis 74030]
MLVNVSGCSFPDTSSLSTSVARAVSAHIDCSFFSASQLRVAKWTSRCTSNASSVNRGVTNEYAINVPMALVCWLGLGPGMSSKRAARLLSRRICSNEINQVVNKEVKQRVNTGLVVE